MGFGNGFLTFRFWTHRELQPLTNRRNYIDPPCWIREIPGWKPSFSYFLSITPTVRLRPVFLKVAIRLRIAFGAFLKFGPQPYRA